MAVILQPVYDAEGKLLYQPGDQLAEDHKILKSIPGDAARHVIVETDEPPAKPEAKPAADQGSASDSVSVSKTGKGSKT
jgi:hypothetical protein